MKIWCHCQFVLMLLNTHFFLGPLGLLIGIPFHWLLFASRSRFSLSMEVCWARHPPIIADHHDTPAVTGGLHPLLDTSPKNRRTLARGRRYVADSKVLSYVTCWVLPMMNDVRYTEKHHHSDQTTRLLFIVARCSPYRHLIEVLLSARIQSKRVIVRVTWACSSTARWACELRSRRPRK